MSKLKVKKDAKDAQGKAQSLFKKATNAMAVANRTGKAISTKT